MKPAVHGKPAVPGLGRLTGVAGILGLLGSLVCAGAMWLAAAGAVGVGTAAGAAGMAGMGSTAPSGAPGPVAGLLRFLLQAGPVILVLSIGAIVLSLAGRRRSAAVPALLAGGVLYWGMYAQSSVALMSVSIILGLLVWAGIEFWIRATSRRCARVGR